MMRGQASLDFLSTYGWGIMILLAVGGTLIGSGIFSPESKLPDQLSVSDGFAIEAAGIGMFGNGNMGIIKAGLKNIQGSNIDLINVKCIADDGTEINGNFRDTSGTNPINSIGSGEEFIIQCQGNPVPFSSGQKTKIDFLIEYKFTRNTYKDVAKGTIVSTVSDAPP